MPDKYACPLTDGCGKHVAVTSQMNYRKHNDSSGKECLMSGKKVSQTQQDKGPIGPDERPDVPEEGRDFGKCVTCNRPAVPLDGEGMLAEHMGSSGKCPGGASSPAPASPALMSAKPSGPSPGSTTESSESQPSTVPTSSQSSARFQQPTWPLSQTFSQPVQKPNLKEPEVPMGDFDREFTAGFKQMFHHWNTRRSSDNRSAQTTLGPSEIGTPCDRRLVMRLLGVPAVNPGGDGWAAWVGTQGHSGLATMLEWADGGSGRYGVEVPLVFPSMHVPRGTSDALDRHLRVAADWKFMGKWSLDKLRRHGPPDTYRVQIHVYGYGQQLRGERVDRVAIVGLPRDGSSLDDMYVWSEPYDPSVAIAALARVERLAESARGRVAVNGDAEGVWRSTPIANDCTYCPFYLPKGDNTNGCNGKE